MFRHATWAASALCAFILSSVVAAAVQPGMLVYVPNQSTNSVRVFTTDAAGGLTPVTTIAVGVQPKEALVRSDQAYVYVANNIGTISVISTATNTVVQTTALVMFSFPWGMAFNPDNSRLYVANRNNDTVAVYSVAQASGQLTPLATFGNAGAPLAVAVTPDGARLYTANTTGNAVRVFDTSTNALVTSIPVGPSPFDLVLDSAGSRAYVPNFGSNTVSVIDTASNTVVATPATGAGPTAVALSQDGSRLYVLNATAATISQLETATFSEVAPPIASGGANAFGLALTPDGSVLYATNDQNDSVAIFSVGAGGVLTSLGSQAIGLGDSNPFGIAICSNGNNLLRTGLTFVARTSSAIGCMGSTPTFTGGTLLLSSAGQSIPQPFVLGTGGGTIDTNGNDAEFSGVFSGSGALTKAGAGILTLSGTNTNSGSTTIGSGTLRAGAANVFSAASSIDVAAGTTLDLNGFNQAIGALSGAGDVALGTGTLAAGSNGASTTLSGVISGSGGLVKTGSGVLTLSGTNTYTGPTTVSAGTLQVTGSIGASSAVTVDAGAILAGNATVSGAVAVNGTVAPGLSGPGALSTGALTFNAGSTFAVDVAGSAPGTYDQLNVTGTATLGNATLAVTATAAVPVGQVLTIVSATGPIVGTFNGLPNNASFTSGGSVFRITYNANTVTLTSVVAQGITFGPLASRSLGSAPFNVAATASSGLAVTFSSLTPAVCSVSGTTVTLLATGTCTVAANQGGDATFAAAPQVSQSFAVVAGTTASAVTRLSANPASAASSVQYSVTFSGPVTGVDAGDFVLATTGVSGAAITGVSGSGASYTVTVDTGSGAGTLRLDLVDNDSILDATGGPLGGVGAGNGNVAGETYNVTRRTFSGPSATGSGTITATFTGGGAGCTFDVAEFIPVTGHPRSPPSAPENVFFPHGLFDFTTVNCTPGSTITMTVTYPTPVAGASYWKYGPTPSNATPHWYILPATAAPTTMTFSITDGGLGDDDLAANGTIVDQGGPGTGTGGAVPVPTLSEWAMILLILMMMGFGARGLQTRRTR